MKKLIATQIKGKEWYCWIWNGMILQLSPLRAEAKRFEEYEVEKALSAINALRYEEPYQYFYYVIDE